MSKTARRVALASVGALTLAGTAALLWRRHTPTGPRYWPVPEWVTQRGTSS